MSTNPVKKKISRTSGAGEDIKMIGWSINSFAGSNQIVGILATKEKLPLRRFFEGVHFKYKDKTNDSIRDIKITSRQDSKSPYEYRFNVLENEYWITEISQTGCRTYLEEHEPIKCNGFNWFMLITNVCLFASTIFLLIKFVF
jgi:hypothetical protein